MENTRLAQRSEVARLLQRKWEAWKEAYDDSEQTIPCLSPVLCMRAWRVACCVKQSNRVDDENGLKAPENCFCCKIYNKVGFFLDNFKKVW